VCLLKYRDDVRASAATGTVTEDGRVRPLSVPGLGRAPAPTASTIVAICRPFGCDEQWLVQLYFPRLQPAPRSALMRRAVRRRKYAARLSTLRAGYGGCACGGVRETKRAHMRCDIRPCVGQGYRGDRLWRQVRVFLLFMIRACVFLLSSRGAPVSCVRALN
jgi:hypothetical protein